MNTKMDYKFNFYSGITLLVYVTLLLLSSSAISQISPGDLSEAHAHLEGMSNCTECHTLGEKVSNDKCLACHKPLKSRIESNKGYHSSTEIKGKDCIECHSDHHGRKFEMIRFDKDNFNHENTGYNLLGAHKKQECKKCHKKEFISNVEIKKKEYTYLGLGTNCTDCHDDYHQNTLSSDCKKCHDFNAFKPTTGFDHNDAKFQLVGKHTEVECSKCHEVTTMNGSKFQKFSGLSFESCTNCHKDVHENKFGQNCIKCHNEESFLVIKSMDSFDHSKTKFKLENKHQFVDCSKCHKTKLTDPVKYKRCTDCHTDYHEGQFVKKQIRPDCSVCHTTKGFVGSSFTIEKHSKTNFPLLGAHMATPCFVCHKKEIKWDFKNMGNKCADCHNDIHKSYFDVVYYPESKCENCHNETQWASVDFDHNKTNYKLEGKHSEQSCRDCHFKPLADGSYEQRFRNLKDNCTNCHKDEHFKQFENNGVTNCYSCHSYNSWKANKFDHNKARFVLDGKHQNVDCAKCHKSKQIGDQTYVLYKLNEFKCENCH